MARMISAPSLLVMASLALAATSSIVLALRGSHGRGDPSRPASVGNWPPELTRIANRADRVGGRWVNDSDTFLFDGDARACNDFLREYAQVPRMGLSVIIETPRPTTAGATTNPAHDWELHVQSWGSDPTANVRIYLGGRVALADLAVPVTVAVDADGGGPSPDLDAFVAAHRAKRLAVTEIVPTTRPATAPATRPAP